MTNRRAFLGKMGATALIGAGALTACNNAQTKPPPPPPRAILTARHRPIHLPR